MPLGIIADRTRGTAYLGAVIAFTFLIVLFAASAVVTALLYPHRSRSRGRPA